MRRIYSHPNMAMVHLVKNELENCGIETVIQGEYLAAVAGGGAPMEAWFELWVLDDGLLEAATRVVQEAIEHADVEVVGAELWTCLHCGEEVDPQFAACWNCGRERPGEAS